MPELIFHIARRMDWLKATETGEYRRSTLDRTLAEEGFIHASTATQVVGVANRFYGDATDLVLLAIDTGRLRSEIRFEAADHAREGGSEVELYPHIYGTLTVDAV